MDRAKGQYKPKLKSIEKLKRKLKALTCRSRSISLDSRLTKLNYVIRGWVNYFRIANMKSVLERLDKRLRTRIRVVIWKRWKKTKTRCDALVKLGMPFELAFNCANTRKSYQQICKTRYIQFALNNERLNKSGLL